MNEILKVCNISKQMGKNVLFEDISFMVHGGEVIGLLGHNGVGKSTMQRIISNRENATSGEIYNLGNLQSTADEISNIVYVPDSINLLGNLTIEENFELVTKSRVADTDFFEKFTKVIRLNPNDQVSSLSKGNQELVQIIILLSINASLYLLDEPFGAVDVFRRELIQKIVIELSLRNEQSAIIITSHLINEIEPMLSRIIYLDDGAISFDQDLEQIYEESDSLLEYLKTYFGDKVGFDYV